MPLSLPPLNALRAFEAAARNGSYVAAAEELDVSPAAISQQVRHLEDFLGRKLFRRFNNRVVLTDAGQAVFAGSATALQSISALTEQVMAGESRSRLVISVLPSIAHRWLEPQLSGILHSEPRLRVDVRIEDDPVDFARHNIDLRMCYGTNLYPDMTTVLLNYDEVLPLCSPSYLERNPKAAEGMAHVPDDDLIHTNWGPSFVSHPTWQSWFAAEDRSRPEESKGYRVGLSSLALDLAREGIGVALGQRMMGSRDIRAGRLIALSHRALPLGHPYGLVHPPSKINKAGLRSLIDWLVSKAAGTPENTDGDDWDGTPV
jgi:LysR family transcriptional regulator, glycine cleavage system transcriptional activator